MTAGLPKVVRHSLRVLSGLTAVLMISTRELDIRFVIFFAALFLTGFVTEKIPVFLRILGRFQPVFALGLLVLAGFDFVAGSQSFLICVAHFLLSLQGVRLLSIQTVRDSLGSLLLSSMMLLSASTLFVDWWFFVGLVLFLPILVWGLILSTLILDHQIVESSKSEALSAKERENIAAGLSVFGFPDEREPVWERMIPVARTSTLIAFFTSAFFCGLLFVVFPRLNFQGFRGQFLQPVHKTGFTSQVDLHKGTSIFEDNSIVMRIQMEPENRNSWSGYLRGATLSYFDGRRWSRDTTLKSTPLYGIRGSFHLPGARSATPQAFDMDCFLESMESPLLFLPLGARRVVMDRPSLMLGEDGSLQRLRNDSWRIRYQINSESDETSRLLTDHSGPDHRLSLANAQVLPASMDLGPIRQLLSTWTKDNRSPKETALQISKVLSETYRYSLDLPGTSAERPLEQFLLESKKGNCEFFASALCVLLRMNGIPARMATGFYAHEWNPRGNYFVVRMKDAHAWVEAYIDGHWIRLDPTPRNFSEETDSAGGFRSLRETLDLINLKWNRYILSYDMERQVGFLRQLSQASSQIKLKWSLPSFRFSLRLKEKSERVSAAAVLPWVGGILILSIGLIFIRTQRERRRPNWIYQALLNVLKKKGWVKPNGLTLNEFLTSLQPKLGELSGDALQAADYYHQLRFGGREKLLKADIESIKKSLHRLSR